MRWWKDFTIAHHKFLLVTVKELFNSVLNYPQIKLGIRFLDHLVQWKAVFYFLPMHAMCLIIYEKLRTRCHSQIIKQQRRWCTPADASAAITAQWPLSSAMRSNDDIDWPVYSITMSHTPHSPRGLPPWCPPFIVPSSMISSSVSRRQTCPNHDSLRYLTTDSKSSRRPIEKMHQLLNWPYFASKCVASIFLESLLSYIQW